MSQFENEDEGQNDEGQSLSALWKQELESVMNKIPIVLSKEVVQALRHGVHLDTATKTLGIPKPRSAGRPGPQHVRVHGSRGKNQKRALESKLLRAGTSRAPWCR